VQIIDTEVLVIGGGPSGANAARYLALGGKDVVLIEKNLAFEKPCGGGLFIKAFDEFDIPKELIKKEVTTIEIVSPNLEKTSVDISNFPLGVVHRQEFDAKLRQMASEAGAKVVEAKIYSVVSKKDSVIAYARKPDGRSIEIHSQYLIAADGVNSLIRRRMLNETPSRVLTYYADLKNQETQACQFWFGDDISPKHYAWIFPHHNGVNVGLVANDKHRMRQFYQRFFEKASIEGEIPKPKGYFIPHWKEMTLYKERIFYVGDSASLVLPFTYEGIYYALKSAKLAADAILANDPTLYEKTWNRLYLKKFRFLRLLQTIFLKNDWFANKMCQLYRHKRFQRSVLGYWSGTREPAGVFATIFKTAKALIFYK